MPAAAGDMSSPAADADMRGGAVRAPPAVSASAPATRCEIMIFASIAAISFVFHQAGGFLVVNFRPLHVLIPLMYWYSM